MTLDKEKLIKQDKPDVKQFRINLKMFNQVLFLIIIVLFVYYIVGANNLTVQGFKLQELKRQLKELQGENNNLELAAMSLGSYNNLSEKVKNLNMVAVGKVEYLSNVESLVAKK